MAEHKKNDIHALTNINKGIARNITTPVEIKDVFSSNFVTKMGIWDTGAIGSVITKSTANALGLSSIKKVVSRGVHGEREVNVYYVNITLNNKNITLNARVTECDELSNDNSVGMLNRNEYYNNGRFCNYKLSG